MAAERCYLSILSCQKIKRIIPQVRRGNRPAAALHHVLQGQAYASLQRLPAEAGGGVSCFSRGRTILFNDKAPGEGKINLEERCVSYMARSPPRPGSAGPLSNEGLPLAGFQAGSKPNELEAQMMPKTPWSSQ